MVSTADFKTGLTIAFEGNIYQIIDFQHVKPGKGGAFVRTRLKNLRTQAVLEHTFTAGVKVEKAQIEKVPMQFLYQAGEQYFFMNMNSYEQIELSKSEIGNTANFLKESLDVDIMYYNQSEVLGVILPDKIVYKVSQTEPAVKGDTKTNALKDAIIETGLLVKVPLFIEIGEQIVVSTIDGSYVSKG